jgi:hypothetical protein
MDMEKKWTELSEIVWVSRFWASYQCLSEPLKDGFAMLVKSISDEARQNSASPAAPVSAATPSAVPGEFHAGQPGKKET